jgi:hypothetical protein
MAGIAWKEDNDLQNSPCPFIGDSVNSPEITRNRILNPANFHIPRNGSNDAPTRKLFTAEIDSRAKWNIRTKSGLFPAQKIGDLKYSREDGSNVPAQFGNIFAHMILSHYMRSCARPPCEQ